LHTAAERKKAEKRKADQEWEEQQERDFGGSFAGFRGRSAEETAEAKRYAAEILEKCVRPQLWSTFA
jgi:hypothetical protein